MISPISQTQETLIPVFKPSYSEEEVSAVRECLEKGWTGCGPKVKEFEDAFAAYVGAKYAVATNSCTASLHLALKVLGLGGAEVISTPVTFVSTNHAILYNNAVPVFADVDEETLNISPASIAENITPQTKALIMMHFGGNACDIEKILALAIQHNLYVIEDAAHAAGGAYRGKKLGTFGMLGCYSFHAVKNMATGDGGMIVTDNKKFYDRLLKLRWVGISRDTWNRAEQGTYSWDYNVEELGFKYQMNDISAAIGLVQLRKLDAMNQKRRDLADRYREKLKAIPQVKLLKSNQDGVSAQHNFVIRAERRNELIEYLKTLNISAGVHYRPNNHYGMYQHARGKTPAAETIWKEIVTLPLFPDLRYEDQDRVFQALLSFYQ